MSEIKTYFSAKTQEELMNENPILKIGIWIFPSIEMINPYTNEYEIGIKIGDGKTTYNELTFFNIDMLENIKHDDKENNMNYDFHIGDYVETTDGGIGYIDHTNDYVSWYCTKCDNWFAAGFSYSVISKETDMPMTHFARIGKYDFTNQDKQIEHFEYNHLCSGKLIVSKINELVDAVNELRKK